MKKLILLLIIFTSLGNLQADIAVKSFRKLESDMTARIDAPKRDQNGDVCAIIKVVTTQTGFIWEPDGLGIVSAENKGGEYWIYVPFGAKRITIKHPQLGVLRDYLYPMSIERATVYEMMLVTGRDTTIVEETIESQWLVITPEPANALVYINDEFVKTGEYIAKLKPGAYNYRVELPLYHTEAGSVEVGNTKKTLSVKLKPAFGYIKISSQPESGAQVFVNGKLTTGTTPLTTEPIASGEHTVQVVKEMYQPITRKVQVMDGQTIPLDVILQPNFAELTINAPSGASIVLNNQQKGTGSWSGRLGAGIYSIEAMLDKHHTAKQDIELATGDKRTIELQPTPIYGSLDVISSPSGATITIDGKNYGTTPTTINKILIGKYTIQLDKTGYAPIEKLVVITESNENKIDEILTMDVLVEIKSNPINAEVFIENKHIGNTPHIYTMNEGKVKILLEKPGYRKHTETIFLGQKEVFVDLKPQKSFYDYFTAGISLGGAGYNANSLYLNCGAFANVKIFEWLFVRNEFIWGLIFESGGGHWDGHRNHLICLGYPFKSPKTFVEYGIGNSSSFKSHLFGISLYGTPENNLGLRYSHGIEVYNRGVEVFMRLGIFFDRKKKTK